MACMAFQFLRARLWPVGKVFGCAVVVVAVASLIIVAFSLPLIYRCRRYRSHKNPVLL